MYNLYNDTPLRIVSLHSIRCVTCTHWNCAKYLSRVSDGDCYSWIYWQLLNREIWITSSDAIDSRRRGAGASRPEVVLQFVATVHQGRTAVVIRRQTADENWSRTTCLGNSSTEQLLTDVSGSWLQDPLRLDWMYYLWRPLANLCWMLSFFPYRPHRGRRPTVEVAGAPRKRDIDRR